MEGALQSPLKVRRPVIVDTDLSFDDYVALLYLLQRPDIDIRAITVVNGVVHVKQGVENVRRLLSLVGRMDIPVAGGSDRPLTGQLAFPASWRVLFDFGPRLIFPQVPSATLELPAHELIRQQSVASGIPITVVALGPLTNLALALRADPTLATRLDTIFISGGAIGVPGIINNDVPVSPNTVSEWNLYLDSVAADIVFNSGARLALVPLDVTHVYGPHPLLFSRDFVDRLAVSARGQTSKLMVRFLRSWQIFAPRHQATAVWDAAVAAIAADPTIGCDWRDLAIHIATQPERVAGQTVIDDDKPANVRVCLGGDQTAFEAAFLTVVQGIP